MKRICLVFMVVFIASAAKAQTHFKRIDNTVGLSNNTVLTILQDKRGFMWFGTDDGLNRYDGHSFKIFKPDFKSKSGISHNIAKVLFEDHAGNIWIGTDGGGLNKFDPVTEKFTHYRATKENPSGLNHNNVTAIAEENDRYLWIGTYGGGLNRLDPSNGTFEHYIYKEGESNTVGSFFINCLALDDIGNLWIGTWGRGLDKLNLHTMTFTHYQHREEDPGSISDNTVNSIFIDRKKNLWLGTWEGGLNMFDQARKKFIHFSRKEKTLPVNNVRAITADSNGDLWLASFGEGLVHFNHYKKECHQFVHRDDNVKSIGSDNLWTVSFAADMLWAGSIEGGLYTLDFTPKKFQNIQSLTGDDGAADVVDALCETQNGDIWAGTFGKGLFVLDRELNNKKNSPAKVLSQKITSILTASNGTIWITTDAGVTKYDPKTKQSRNYVIAAEKPGLSFSNTKVVYEDRDGDIWIGTWGGGLNRYNEQTDSFAFYFPPPDKNENGLADGNIWSIVMDHEGMLWIGTNDGLSRFDKRSGKFFTYRHNDDSTSLSDNHVTSIYMDREYHLWIGTLGGGINLFNKTSEDFTSFTERDGLNNNLVKSILEDGQHNLWIATNTGLSRFNYETRTFQRYDNAQQQNSYRIGSALKRSNGEMLFGGVNGITRFKPDSISTHITSPKVYLTDISLFGQPLHPGEKVNDKILPDSALMFKSCLNFSYDENMITLRFSSPQFSDNSKPLFSYKLEGFDSKWFVTASKAPEGMASYTNLPPGNYAFKVRAADEDGEFGDNATALTIVIQPPFWETIYFKLFLLLMATLLLYLAYRIISTKKEEKHRQAALMANQKIKELENENLQQEIDYKNRELANISMNLVEKTKFLTEQIRKLEGIATISDREIKAKLNHLIENFNKEITTEKDWEYFELHFDKVHQNFITNLKTNFPDLSATDIRLAALIRMNLSNKEIAELMNKSVRSIESSRYRLRKSLNLNQGDNLTDYLFRL